MFKNNIKLCRITSNFGIEYLSNKSNIIGGVLNG